MNTVAHNLNLPRLYYERGVGNNTVLLPPLNTNKVQTVKPRLGVGLKFLGNYYKRYHLFLAIRSGGHQTSGKTTCA